MISNSGRKTTAPREQLDESPIDPLLSVFVRFCGLDFFVRKTTDVPGPDFMENKADE